MIETIRIANVATYGPDKGEMANLSAFNYIYGPNGAGKTTLSKLINGPSDDEYKGCNIGWKGGIPLQALVYNRDFVDTNLDPSTSIKGIFTLGHKNIATIQAIEAAKEIRDTWAEKIAGLTETLQGNNGAGGKMGELSALRLALKEKCWEQKKKHDAQFQHAFAAHGVRGDSEKFLGQVLLESKSNKAPLETLDVLAVKAETVFGKAPVAEQLLSSIATASLLSCEIDPILTRKIVGREDVDIAAMIKKLSNSDWVKEGRVFFEANDGSCPFCQQIAPHTLEQSLTEYFDEAFINDTKAINELQINYKGAVQTVLQVLDILLISPSLFLDTAKIFAKKELLEARTTVNLQRIAEKVREPSSSVSLESLMDVLTDTNDLIAGTNEQIGRHNQMVADLVKEKKKLTDRVWRYILDVELKQPLADYTAKSAGVEKAITGLQGGIATANNAITEKDIEIRELEKQTTSTQPAVDAINSILKSFNFSSFKIVPADSHTYRLVRANGLDARKSLSEGERTFVTFLYFYQLLKGSDSDSGITTNRIVVFDDPVSSLDSDILFIVSSLIRDTINEVRHGKGLIKQVFVLTHNVYFHKEVTFASNRGTGSMNEETFWTVRKREDVSELVRHDGNPIKTSYELLWQDVRKPENVGLSIQNTLRRIMESYFKILGGIDKDNLLGKFEGIKKTVCASLLSWVNDGSHGVHDDIYVAADQGTVDVYLRAFHEIFFRSGQESHYQLMMREDYVPLPPIEAILETPVVQIT
ncbi:AAA family ATPase [Rhodanobacter glycinis]|uniref:AAA family ATPase n=1 Tax=Rhodanobacter glycinis TaxID=582702 RepID=UPI00112AB1D3|nr:AAA family ATPase [Rhodanobacter glycinis]TPG50625.1 AAA family ATPase [Rhodanobacter glycinis]